MQKNLKQLFDLLDQLIEVARQLKDSSQHFISEEELIPLQKKQDSILKQVEKLDEELHSSHTDFPQEEQQKIHDKLTQFSELNAAYINNVSESHGLIQFDLKRKRDEEEELPHLRILPKKLFNKNEEKQI